MEQHHGSETPFGAHGDALHPHSATDDLDEIEPDLEGIGEFDEEDEIATALMPPPRQLLPGRRSIHCPDDLGPRTPPANIPINLDQKLAEIKVNLSQFVTKICNQSEGAQLVKRMMEGHHDNLPQHVQEQIVIASRHLREDELLEVDILQGMLEIQEGAKPYAEIFKEFLRLRRKGQ